MTEALLGNIMVDCRDPERLQKFYGELLGWEQCRLFGCRAVRSSQGVVLLFSPPEQDYAPPVWPEEPGAQQKQMHFDFQVEDVAEAVKRAESLGAARAGAGSAPCRRAAAITWEMVPRSRRSSSAVSGTLW